MHLTQVYSNNPHTTDDLKMAIAEYMRDVDRAILNTVFQNTTKKCCVLHIQSNTRVIHTNFLLLNQHNGDDAPQNSRTQFGVSINVWRPAGDTSNITCYFLYCNHKVHRDLLITLYIYIYIYIYIYMHILRVKLLV